MVKVIGVRFRTAGKIYYFDPLNFQVKRGDHVIVETARGVEYGTVVGSPREVEDDKVVQPLKPVLRVATERDDEQEAGNRQRKEAFKICQEKIRKHGLEMKLIDAEYTFDNNKVLFYFTADGRVDFRELVKDLAGVFKTRIELRQIGVRDETKILGGIGICGRVLCCHSHLSEFIPVSIKMAKEQNLSLNPGKISGVCGRLMCCLKHEEETYEELNRRLPNTGDYVTTDDGLKGEVSSVNVLRQLVKVLVEVNDEKELREYKVEQLKFRRRQHGRGRKNGEGDEKEMKDSKSSNARRRRKENQSWMTDRTNLLKSGERIDDLQRNGLKIIQDPGRFCFGMDAVLLSGFASAGIRQGMRVLDLGTGTGIIPLLLSAKTQAESLCGLEIQADSADMARRSVAMNHLEDRISVIQGDIKEADKLFAAASFDVVTSNPPYMIGQAWSDQSRSAEGDCET